MEELIFASAAALAQAIREKQVSSLEVIDAYLARIAQVNPRSTRWCNCGQRRREPKPAMRTRRW